MFQGRKHTQSKTERADNLYSENPEVSVIIVNWNGKKYLKSCLESLRNQTFKDFETIVVDNGSTDDSVPFVRKNFPEARVISLPENQGFCGGNNIGIKNARGKFIALLNNDAEASSNWLGELVNVLENHEDIGFCASKILLYNHRNLVDTCGDYYSTLGVAGKIGHLDKETNYNNSLEVFGACGGAAIYRRKMLEDIGLFDEDFFLSYEDVDLSFRAQLKGYKCTYVPTAKVYHNLSSTIGEYSDNYVYFGQRNLEYTYIKNMPTSLLLGSLPLHLLYDILALVYFVSKGKGMPFIKAKFHTYMALPHLLKKRRTIQNEKKVDIRYIKSKMKKGGLLEKIFCKFRKP